MALSDLDADQVLRSIFDSANQSLKTTISAQVSGAQEVVISHLDDSIKVGDGVDLLAVNADGSINVQMSGTLPIQGGNSTAVKVDGSAVTQPVSGPLTDAQLRASAVPVSGAFYPATQPVSGSVSVSNFPATQAVTGTFWQTTQPVSGSVSVSNFPASQAVTGTFWQATQPVSGPLTDTQLRASAVPVSGTFWQATQPVSGTVTAQNAASTTTTGNVAALNDTVVISCDGLNLISIQALGTWVGTIAFEASVDGTNYNSVTGHAATSISSVSQFTANGVWFVRAAGYKNVRVKASAWTSGTANMTLLGVQSPSAVSAWQYGTWTNRMQDSTGSNITIGQKAMASSLPVVIASDQTGISLGTASGKTNVLKTGSLTSTATTADQVVLTYTVTTGKTLYLQYLQLEARLTAVSATAAILGTISLETPSGTKVATHTMVNPTSSVVDRVQPYCFSEPIAIAAATVIRVVCTPAAATSTLWVANFGGFEK